MVAIHDQQSPPRTRGQSSVQAPDGFPLQITLRPRTRPVASIQSPWYPTGRGFEPDIMSRLWPDPAATRLLDAKLPVACGLGVLGDTGELGALAVILIAKGAGSRVGRMW
jgi:hypothetical protein